MKKELVIIGAGAAGLIAASFAAKRYKVTILEKNSKIAKKILVSGNGKCNITNDNIDINRFHSSHIELVQKILKKFTNQDTVSFFENLGLPLYIGKDGQMFPLSNQASSVVEFLYNYIKSLGVEIITEYNVTKIEKDKNNFLLKSENGDLICDKLIIATGGKSMSKLGSSGDGFEFAASFGHTIIKPNPALVQLNSDFKYLKKLSGVKHFSKVTLISNNQKLQEIKGDVLFTDYGLSGLAVLDLSRDVISRMEQFEYIELLIDLFPNISNEKLKGMFQNSFKNSVNDLATALSGFINKKLAQVVVDILKLDKKIACELNTKELNRLIYQLKNLRLSIEGNRGFEYSEVTSGGITLDELNENLESKLVKDLYFCGEVLDVDGDRGGFNFQWAWSSGAVVGKIL